MNKRSGFTQLEINRKGKNPVFPRAFTPPLPTAKRNWGQEGAGFTLIEILLVVTMLSLVGITIYTAFSNGVRVWQRMSQSLPEEDVGIFFEKLSGDLRNSFNYSGIKTSPFEKGGPSLSSPFEKGGLRGIKFTGTKDTISFPTLLNISDEGKTGKGIGRVTYFFDVQAGSLNKREESYSQLYQNSAVASRKLADDIKALNLQYYCYDTRQKVYFWKNDWQEGLPLAVKVEVGYGDGAKVCKVISLPVGG